MIFFLSTIHAQNLEEPSKQTQALADAIRANNFELFESNYSVDAVIGIDPVSGLHPLHLACREGNIEIVTFLLKKERSLETGIYVTQEEKPPMIQSMEQGNLEIMQLLLDKGSRDANNTWMGKTYLFHADDLNCSKAVKDLLIRNGADVKRAETDHPQWHKYSVEVQEMAKEMTAELTYLNLNRYREIDANIIHLRMAELLQAVREKYANDVATLTKEEAEIIAYRNKKLKPYLSKNQASQLR